MRAQNIYRKKFTRANILFPENINTEYTKTHFIGTYTITEIGKTPIHA